MILLISFDFVLWLWGDYLQDLRLQYFDTNKGPYINWLDKLGGASFIFAVGKVWINFAKKC